MKKSKWLLLLLCFVLCFGFVYSASAASPLSAKQLLLGRLQSLDFGQKNELDETSSGTASYKINELSGTLLSGLEPLQTLAGTELKLDYKLNTPAKELGVNYDLLLNKNNFIGNLFIDDDKLILSTEVLRKIKEVYPDFDNEEFKDLPPYVYFTDSELKAVWDAIHESEGQSVPPELKELLIFFLEAVPDKYFTVSLVNQRINFSIDQQGLEDVTFSVFQKTKNEKERFATLAADFVVILDPTKEREEIKKEILDSLEESIKNGDFPDSPEEKAELHKLTEVFTLEKLTFEIPLLSSGQGRFAMAVNFGGSSTLTGRLTMNVDFSGSKESICGTYAIGLTAQEKEQNVRVDGQIIGEFRQTCYDMKNKATFKVNVKELSGTGTLLNFVLQANLEAGLNKTVQVNIPVLTESNSMNIEPYINEPPAEEVTVFVDGEPVDFDVEPLVMNGRIMVPVRNLAEAMGFVVTWVEPDRINMVRGDTSISMYVGKHTYTVNGVEKTMDAAPFIEDGKRTMVPVRFVAEELGCRVEYDEISNTVYIYSE